MRVVLEAKTYDEQEALTHAIAALAEVGVTAKLTGYDDVKEFHARFNVPEASAPSLLSPDKFDFRMRFLEEELNEFHNAHRDGNLLEVGDALVDLVYVAYGTAAMMGLPWYVMWDEVQRANMSKVRAAHAGESKRRSALDVVKPEGWVPPDHSRFIGANGWPTF